MHLLAQPAGTAFAPHGGDPRRYDRHWTPVHVDVVTGDLAAAVARATAAGATLERPIERRSWNAIAGLADPFGSGFDLVEEPGNVRTGALDLAIDVPDVARAADFYAGAWDLTLRDEPMPGLWTRLSGAPCTVHVQLAPARAYERHWTPVHVDVVTPDLEPAMARARRAGATLERPIETAAWGRLATFADPFGHGFCLVEPSALGYAALLDEEKS